MRTKIIAVVAMFLVVISFSACGANDPDSVAIFSGEWELESIEEDGNITIMAEYKDVGLSGNLILDKDLSLIFDLLGDQSKGTWKAKNSTEMSMSIDGVGSIDGILIDGKLLIEEDAAKFVFAKK